MSEITAGNPMIKSEANKLISEKKEEKKDLENEKSADKIDSENSQDANPSNANANIVDVSLKLPPKVQEQFFSIKKRVIEAIAVRRTFMIYGRGRVIRECMLKRGWCEKYYKKNVDPNLNVDTHPLVLLSGIGDLSDIQNQRLLISKMLSNHIVDFLWHNGVDMQGWPSEKNKTTLFNRYCRPAFTSKIGLCLNVKQMQWYYEPGVSHTLFPRCYNLCQSEQMENFIDDFRLTACQSLLKWLVNKIDSEGEASTRSPSGTVPAKALDFAIKRCSDYIKSQSHEDIDQEVERVWTHQWSQFIGWYYKIIKGQSLFVASNMTFHKYYLTANDILQRMKIHWPQMEMDGMLNIWIVKPGNRSRGRGIVLVNKLEDVVSKVNPNNKTGSSRYVVQKYIERPFLIYDTKFDIRQWFLVTKTLPLTIWIYKESYLRFCTQKFTLADFHESIHLCNYSIQCKYTNSSDRDSALPVDNMWDATTFKEFLKNQGHPNVWDEIIYPGMKQGLIGSLLTSQETMDPRKNSFELYGADFMVMSDFSIWLIEINNHPDMSYSTSVTTRLCKQVMEDTVKVVIDSRDNKNVDTGQFELIYKQRIPSCQPNIGSTLSLQGTRILSCEKKFTPSLSDSKIVSSVKTPPIVPKKLPLSRYHLGPVIVDLIEELEMQLDQDISNYFSNESSKLKPSLPMDVLPEIKKDKATTVDSETETLKSTSLSSQVTPLLTPKLKSAPSIQKSKTSESQMSTNSIPKRVLVTRNYNLLKVPTDISQIHQNIYKRMTDFAKQSSKLKNYSTNTQRTAKKDLNEKKTTVDSAVKQVIIAYNRSGSLPVKGSSIRTHSALNNSEKSMNSGGTKKKIIRKIHKKRSSKQKKVHVNVSDIFAVGLGLIK